MSQDRSCGECTMCCIDLSIDSPELKKHTGVECDYCIEKIGCSIYSKRPAECSNWFCLWMVKDVFGDEWRPDRSGILLNFMGDKSGIPDSYNTQDVIDIRIIHTNGLLNSLRFLDFVCNFIDGGVPLFVSVSGGPGYLASKVFLNDGMASAVQSRDIEKVTKELHKAIQAAIDHPKKRVELGGE
ncbi:MAG: hypothetical protein HQL69_19150 [Magnetococcales bacterium]|nr:hypothetical protein [Magnetococcales bacterium]